MFITSETETGNWMDLVRTAAGVYTLVYRGERWQSQRFLSNSRLLIARGLPDTECHVTMALCFCLCVSVFGRELGPCPENLRAPVAFRPLGFSLSDLIGSFDVPMDRHILPCPPLRMIFLGFCNPCLQSQTLLTLSS